MSVDIKILGDVITSGIGLEEYLGAELLKDIFIKEFEEKNEVDGVILIKPNFKAVGQDTEDIDIVVWFNLENYKETFSCGYSYFDEVSEKYKVDNQLNRREVNFKSLLLTIELKSHNNDGIEFFSNDVKVKYKGKLSSAYLQSDKQKYALKNFISFSQPSINNLNVQIRNMIWFPNFKGNIPWGKCNLRNLILGNNLTFKKLIETVLSYKPPVKHSNRNLYYQNAYDSREISDNIDDSLQNVFLHYDNVVKVQKGDLSRRKLEKVIQNQLDGLYKDAFESIGQNTLLISGVPGSGKTLILLRFSYFLAMNKNSRSLIITYNKALIADINRLSRLAGFKDDPSSASIGTSTCLKLMRKLLIEFKLYDEEPNHLSSIERVNFFKINFTDKYEQLLNELYELITIANQDDLNQLKTNLPELNYEYIFIDESQDWFEKEKDILYLIFGSNNCIISYGSHQLLRNQIPLDWSKGSNGVKRLDLDVSYRQKSNLCYYIKDISSRLDFTDNIKINNQIGGGKVLIYNRELNSVDIKNQINYCVKDCKNASYDVLMLIGSSDNIHKKILNDEITIHDGTIERNKLSTPFDMDAIRVFNYQSCRGLEGWVVIANNLDLFLEEIDKLTVSCIEGLSLLETKEIVVTQWLYMILSRPIDTLVISLKNPNTRISRLINTVANNFTDFCEIYN